METKLKTLTLTLIESGGRRNSVLFWYQRSFQGHSRGVISETAAEETELPGAHFGMLRSGVGRLSSITAGLRGPVVNGLRAIRVREDARFGSSISSSVHIRGFPGHIRKEELTAKLKEFGEVREGKISAR